MTQARDHRSIRQYLLGELPEDEADRLERDYFESDDAFDELVAAENELIDAHLAGRLSASEEAGFARHFLTSPERQERVAFARALRDAAAKAPAAAAPVTAADAPVRRVPSWLAWAAALLLGTAVGWSIERARSAGLREARAAAEAARRQEASLRATLAAQQAQLDGLREELARTRAQPERAPEASPFDVPGRFVAALLRAGLQRDAAPRPPVVVPPGTSELRLQLVVPADAYRSYTVSVETADGEPVASRAGLAATTPRSPLAVEMRLDPRPLASGEYVVFVRGLGRDGVDEPVGEYAFRLKRD